MGKFQDLTGQVFNQLIVIERAESRRQPCGKLVTLWKCKCDCGNETIVRGCDLKDGNVKNCGHLTVRHGLSNSRLYDTYHHMIQRCCNPKDKGYKQYGGRGIKICNEWLKSFMNFYNWAINNGYSDDLSIDRINVNGNYEPNNCRWANAKQQSDNRRCNQYIEYKGQRKTLADWSKEANLKPNVFRNRILLGWDMEKIFNTPTKEKKLAI